MLGVEPIGEPIAAATQPIRLPTPAAANLAPRLLPYLHERDDHHGVAQRVVRLGGAARRDEGALRPAALVHVLGVADAVARHKQREAHPLAGHVAQEPELLAAAAVPLRRGGGAAQQPPGVCTYRTRAEEDGAKTGKRG